MGEKIGLTPSLSLSSSGRGNSGSVFSRSNGIAFVVVLLVLLSCVFLAEVPAARLTGGRNFGVSSTRERRGDEDFGRRGDGRGGNVMASADDDADDFGLGDPPSSSSSSKAADPLRGGSVMAPPRKHLPENTCGCSEFDFLKLNGSEQQRHRKLILPAIETATLGSMLVAEEEAAFLFRSASSSSSSSSLGSLQQKFLHQHLALFVKDVRVRSILGVAAKAAAEDHRTYAAFSRALRRVATAARAAHRLRVAEAAAPSSRPPSPPAAQNSSTSNTSRASSNGDDNHHDDHHRSNNSGGGGGVGSTCSSAPEPPLSFFVSDAGALAALEQAAAASAKSQRMCGDFSRALRGVAAIARLIHVRAASVFDYSLSGKKGSAFSSSSPDADSSPSALLQPQKIELFRFQTSLDDEKLTVPFVPTNMKDLEIVAPTNFGLVAGFTPPPAFVKAGGGGGGSSKKESSLRVATLLTGHMRSYRVCAERLKHTVLEPTNSALFIASYPDPGYKRHGKREAAQSVDIVSWNEVQNIYSPHLTGLFIGEVPLLRRRLEMVFPHAFDPALKQQFSWMLYQFLLIEIGVNMTQAFANNWDLSSDVVGEMAFGDHRKREVDPAAKKMLGTWPWGRFWGRCGGSSDNNKDEDGTTAAADASCSLIRFLAASSQKRKQSSSSSSAFDVFIRLRPDLFIVGTIRLSGIALQRPAPQRSKGAVVESENSNTATGDTTATPVEEYSHVTLELGCGGEARTERNYPPGQWLANFDSGAVLVTPHHPQMEWILDKTSDLSLVATYKTATRYLAMHSYLSRLSRGEQDATFVPLCTAERLWKKRAGQMRLLMNRTFGWFAMLRNASTFVMGRYDGASSERRRKLVRGIFAITNPDKIPCPLANGTMLTLPPPERKKPRGGKKGAK